MTKHDGWRHSTIKTRVVLASHPSGEPRDFVIVVVTERVVELEVYLANEHAGTFAVVSPVPNDADLNRAIAERLIERIPTALADVARVFGEVHAARSALAPGALAASIAEGTCPECGAPPGVDCHEH